MPLIRATFDDLDDMCQTLRSWDMEFLPLAGIPHAETAGSLVQITSHDVQYGYAEFAAGLSMSGTPPKGLVTFNLMEPSRRRYWLRGHDLGDGMGWVFPPGAELRSVSAPGFQVHTLSVSEERIEQVAAALEIDSPTPSKRPETFAIPAAALAEARRCLRALRDGNNTLMSDPVRDVLQALIPCWLQQDPRGSEKRARSRARDIAVSRCLELIDSHDPVQASAMDLHRECRVSERTLQYAFRERFGVTPHAFIRSRRLAKARSALKRADHGAVTVGDIAARYGFWHLGRFAAEYRKAFGELPRDTLKRVPPDRQPEPPTTVHI